MSNNERETHSLNLADHKHSTFQRTLERLPIESLILKYGNDRRLDIGCLCYASRTYGRSIPKPVKTQSFRPERCLPIKLIVDNIADRFYLAGSLSTAYSTSTDTITFSNWCDQNNHGDFLVSADAYKSALDDYTRSLIYRMNNTKDLAESTGRQLQITAIKNGQVAFPDSSTNFRNDLPLITYFDDGEEKTATPSAEAMAKHLTPCQYLFDGISDFILNEKPFPHFMPYMDTTALLLPTSYAISTPAIVNQRVKIESNICWNYANGTVRSLEECIANAKTPPHHAVRKRNSALSLLEDANENMRHTKRLWLAAFAHDAFISLFVANTGMNEAPLRNLLWTNDYQVVKGSSAGFVVIKYRAGGMEQNFEIKKVFLKSFRKFVKLRDYLCQDTPSRYLFVNFSKHGIQDHPIMASSISNTSTKMTSFVDPNYEPLNYRQLRKYKSVYLLSENHSIDVVAAVMQSSGRTILKSYAQAEEKKAIDEISATLTFIISTLEGQKHLVTPAGDCSGEKPAVATTAPLHYEPNCKNFVGCVFCSEFRLHANEQSIRKILSMRYVTAERLSSCADLKHFEEMHGPVIERIDHIMENLCQIRPEMKEVVSRVKLEIECDYKLSKYWETLYERLLKIKVL
jgi:hypothetical protein